MKRFLFIALMSPIFCFSQELKENKVDDFTKSVVKRTSWERLCATFKMNLSFRVSRIDSIHYFDLKMMLGAGKVFSIPEGAKLMFKLSNDSIVELENLKYAITCSGCGATGFAGSGAQGISTSYVISQEDAKKLKDSQFVKMRIYTADGYVEEEIKDKNAEKLIKAITLTD